ncbi:putative MFS-type transporter-like protein [Hapsidospora chrysogenum ATCC 11550]|uniref:Putative MFS-type transporter-like protein n=1 Tax=Hapsidospora chrysogenum (strain ATCC 11550 / CBS 779.69 / DSM 880 / IAM 14645 / JCM 23072 / IMI 49137) TaxID=857340 RepID=A0A086SV89_HAPC1|nr:putative MFS-type transporter-like protein [Hapsidospora chrysogenum ATCC 11550]
MSATEKPPRPPRDDAIESHEEDSQFVEAPRSERRSLPVKTESRDEQQLDDSSPILYLYLTFDSDLPSPPRQPDAAPPPNLGAYVSPLTWSSTRKNVTLALGSIATFLTAYCAGSYSPPSRLIARDLGSTHIVILVGISTFCVGFSLAPMVLAPVSEIWGRYPVFIVAGVVLVVFQAACALVTNAAGMLVCRFFVGAGASVFSSVVGGVLADLWDKEDRNTAMALFSGAVLVGTGAGPLVTAGMVSAMDDGTQAWKWSFWHQAISNGLLLISLAVFFRETRASVLLSRKAKELNRWYMALEREGVYGVWVRDADMHALVTDSESSTGSNENGDGVNGTDGTRTLRRVRWLVKADEERASLGTMMATSAMRPFYMLVTEPVVFWFSLWAAFAWGVLYLAFAVVAYLHLDDFNAACRSYIAMIAGSAAATAVSVWQEDLLNHPQWRQQRGDASREQHTDSKFWALMRRSFPAEAPEARLYFSCITGFFLPAGLFGAFLVPSTSSPDDSGTSLAIGIGFATWGIYSVYLAAFNYLADTYHVYASSALAANSFCRNMVGGAFPVVTGIMFSDMGIRGAGGMLGALGMALTAIPWVLVFSGARVRARSKMAIK